MTLNRREALMALGLPALSPLMKKLEVSESPYIHRDGLDYMVVDGIEYPVLEMHGPRVLNVEELFDGVEWQKSPKNYSGVFQRIKIWLPESYGISQNYSFLFGVVSICRFAEVLGLKLERISNLYLSRVPESELIKFSPNDFEFLSYHPHHDISNFFDLPYSKRIT